MGDRGIRHLARWIHRDMESTMIDLDNFLHGPDRPVHIEPTEQQKVNDGWHSIAVSSSVSLKKVDYLAFQVVRQNRIGIYLVWADASDHVDDYVFACYLGYDALLRSEFQHVTSLCRFIIKHCV